jgi:plastocyanin
MKLSTIIAIIVVVIVVVIAAAYLGMQNNNNNSGGSGTTTVVENPVTISNFAFNPHIITITVGQNVTWKNNDGVTHTVTSDSNSTIAFNSGGISDGSTFKFRFTQTGDYWYHCSIHSTMTHAIVRVVAATL